MKPKILCLLFLAVPAVSFAQVAQTVREQEIIRAHSVTQKTGLSTLAVTGALGTALAVNMETAFGDGLCKTGDPSDAVMGNFGCNGGLSILHFGFAVTTLGLFIASEVLAEEMPTNPYYTGNWYRDSATQGLRAANWTLFIVQPVLGLISAHPGLVGVPSEKRAMVSRVLRTVHFATGLGLATTYSVNAAFQW